MADLTITHAEGRTLVMALQIAAMAMDEAAEELRLGGKYVDAKAHGRTAQACRAAVEIWRRALGPHAEVKVTLTSD